MSEQNNNKYLSILSNDWKLILGIIYFYISFSGLIFNALVFDYYEINIFHYFVLNDFLFTGLTNYHLIFLLIGGLLFSNLLLTIIAGFLKGEHKENLWYLIIRIIALLPFMVFISVNLNKSHTENSLLIGLFLLSVVIYLTALTIVNVREAEISLTEKQMLNLFYVSIIISLFWSFSLGQIYPEKQKGELVNVKIEKDKCHLGSLIGSTNNYLFLKSKDSISVIPKKEIKIIIRETKNE